MDDRALLTRLQKEYSMLQTGLPPYIICTPKHESLDRYTARIDMPEGSPYENGRFLVDIALSARYPIEPPSMKFRTRIFHPNIDDHGNICLDVLKTGKKGRWNPSVTLCMVLLSLPDLLSTPNPQDPLMPDIADMMSNDYETYDRTAREWTAKYASPVDDDDDDDDDDKDDNNDNDDNSNSESMLSSPKLSQEISPPAAEAKARPAMEPSQGNGSIAPKMKSSGLSTRPKEAALPPSGSLSPSNPKSLKLPGTGGIRRLGLSRSRALHSRPAAKTAKPASPSCASSQTESINLTSEETSNAHTQNRASPESTGAASSSSSASTSSTTSTSTSTSNKRQLSQSERLVKKQKNARLSDILEPSPRKRLERKPTNSAAQSLQPSPSLSPSPSPSPPPPSSSLSSSSSPPESKKPVESDQQGSQEAADVGLQPSQDADADPCLSGTDNDRLEVQSLLSPADSLKAASQEPIVRGPGSDGSKGQAAENGANAEALRKQAEPTKESECAAKPIEIERTGDKANESVRHPDKQSNGCVSKLQASAAAASLHVAGPSAGADKGKGSSKGKAIEHSSSAPGGEILYESHFGLLKLGLPPIHVSSQRRLMRRSAHAPKD